jgi:drug/metabolite transporter (DMT)-like permease
VASVLVFGDTPDGITLLGMAVIALSGVLVAVSGKDRKA